MPEKRGIPLGEWSGADATKALHEAIDRHKELSSRQTRHIIALTWAIMVLTVMMLFAVLAQIYITINPVIH